MGWHGKGREGKGMGGVGKGMDGKGMGGVGWREGDDGTASDPPLRSPTQPPPFSSPAWRLITPTTSNLEGLAWPALKPWERGAMLQHDAVSRAERALSA